MQDKLYQLMDWRFIEGIVYSEEDNPHRILGAHKIGTSLVFQTFQPEAVSVNVLFADGEEGLPMERMDEAGYFAAMMPYRKLDGYRYEVCYEDESKIVREDAYRFAKQQFTEQDAEKMKEGIHYGLYEKMGAHLMEIDGVAGCSFAVWAPNAVRVSVVGDFCDWDGRVYQMRRIAGSGVFEIFIPGVQEGDCYKFEIKVKGGLTYLKADPCAFGAESMTDGASIVRDIRNFEWHDEAWAKGRKEKQAENAPMNIYEVHLGSCALGLTEEGECPVCSYSGIADKLVPYLKDMGYTHVEFMPVMEHVKEDAWGYETSAYYAPLSGLGTPADFMRLVDKLHGEGIGVILDWVPSWFPKNREGLSDFDGTCLYEHLDERQKNHPFRQTRLYNYGRGEVKSFLIANALFWVEQYHVDGLRMVSVDSMLYLDYGKGAGQWIPNMYGGNENLEALEFIKHVNSILKKRNPGVLTVVEDYSGWGNVTASLKEDGLGFDYKWNTSWAGDYVDYIKYDPYFRAYHQDELTLSMVYAYKEKYILPLDHDTVSGGGSLYANMPGDAAKKLAGLRLTFAYQMAHPGKKLLFMRQEFGERESWETDKAFASELLQEEGHTGLWTMVRELNRLYLDHPALYQEDHKDSGFQWVDCIDHESCKISFVRKCGKRKGGEEKLFVVCNFAGIDRDVLVGVPEMGKYKEIFNTDEERFGGTGYVNPRARKAAAKPADGCEQSIKIKMAALGVSIWQISES